MMDFKLDNQIVVITGGGGLLGEQHANAIAQLGGIPILADINEEKALAVSKRIKEQYNIDALVIRTDITNKESVEDLLSTIVEKYNRLDVLINNAAFNPTVQKGQDGLSRFENFDIEQWNKEISIGLTGAMLCSQVIGKYMAENGSGVIINISSDLGLIAPDQRIYQREGLHNDEQPVKPVTYSVIKHGIVGLTKYLSTYWADKGVRVNALCPGGVQDQQPNDFIQKVSSLIPMGRMAKLDEYTGAIQFLCSDASSYMTGQVLVVDGGRTVW